MKRQRRRGGRAQQALTALVLETYGRKCWLRLPGCTGTATTKDHVIPYAQGGTDDLSNFRPACRSCNSKRQDRTMGPRVKVITGPPAAGKSTYVQHHAHPMDVVIDLDKIARAIVPDHDGPIHDYPDHVRHVAIGMRSAAIQRATRLSEAVGVWIIHSVPKPDQLREYERMRWEVITVDPGAEVVRARASVERPRSIDGVVDRWYSQQDQASQASEPPLTTPSRDWGV
ncbi:HNH endonuclease [Arthrobacter woluwensis]|uniref:HNH endonuclease n=1 Tax=Arthrobacter woluwensis TaxID=156980 RepID=UPI001AB01003|nr:HNH endonuclease [Arthrobacter woluwensis]QTF71757.1 hypothetical protein G8758_06890 [Arthrobacter woluwensis]